MTRIATQLTVEQYQGLLTGMPKYCPTTTFTINGKSYTIDEIATLITAILNAMLAVAPARAAWLAATHAVEETIVANGATVRRAREVITTMFGNAPTTLATFAIEPRKSPKPMSGEARTAAAAKAEATRKARGTTSKKQKAKITGNVTGVTITPITLGTLPTAAESTVPTATPVTVAPTATGVVSGTPHA